jgi:hypothetical protein
MRKEKSVAIILICLILVIIFSISTTVNVAKNKRYHRIATKVEINPKATHKSYTNTWTGQGLE